MNYPKAVRLLMLLLLGATITQCNSEKDVVWLHMYPSDNEDTADRFIFRGDSIITHIKVFDPFKGELVKTDRGIIVDSLFNDTMSECKILIIKERETGSYVYLPICSLNADTNLVLLNFMSYTGGFYDLDSLKEFMRSSSAGYSPGLSTALKLMNVTYGKGKKLKIVRNGS